MARSVMGRRQNRSRERKLVAEDLPRGSPTASGRQREPPASQQAGAASALEAPLPPSPNATAAAALHAQAEAGSLAAAMATDADAISEVDESCDVEAGGPPADSADEGEENYIGVIGWELSGGKTSMPCLPALVDPHGPAQ